MGNHRDLFMEYEAVVDAPAAAGGEAAEPASEAPEASAPADAKAPVEVEADAPQYVTPEALEQALAPFAGLAALVEQAEQAQYAPQNEYAEQALPEFDPFDPESYAAYMDAREQRLLGQIGHMLNPVTADYEARNAEQWAEQTFTTLGIPEEAREAVLRTSTSFSQDPYGRQVPPHVAIQQAYQFEQAREQAIREDERAKIKAEADAETQRLRGIADAPNTPTGSGGVEGDAPVTDLRAHARTVMERIRAAESA